MRILVAEDEPRISRFIARGLTASGYTPTVVDDGIAALDYASSGEFDLLVLDVGLPRMDGFAVLRNLRELGSTIPVIIVTARDSVEDTVHGLEGGADDYLSKPFRFEELLARIRLRARDASAAPPSSGDNGAEGLRAGPFVLDSRTRTVEHRTDEGVRTIELSAREYSIALMFFEHPGQVLSREQLLSRVWGFDYDGASNVVDVYVGYLRRKLGADAIITVRGAGYRLAT